MPQLGAAISGLVTAFKATALGTFLTQTTLGKLIASTALTALQAAIAPKPVTPGITTEFTLDGGVNPCSFMLGTSATAGSMVCPPMTHGKAGKTPNAYLTYVIDLGNIPGQSLKRVIIDGAYETIGATVHADYGKEFTGRLAGYAWIKYYDGTQTVADPMLLAKYGSYPERPWLADMIGTGICYAILTFRYNRELFTGFPQLRFECGSIPVYDPRYDSTVGGAGTQRWNDKSTWLPSDNNIVLAYNIQRGIDIPSLGNWGGQIGAAGLPLAQWFAGMNACDVAVTKPGGGTEPTFRAGIEVTVDKEPAAILEELFKASLTQVVEVAGKWHIRTGGPGLPLFWVTDDDIIITRPQEMNPFPGEDGRYNGVTAQWPDPGALYEPKAAPPLYDSGWEAEDGGKRRVIDLQFPAAPYGLQVQRLMRAMIKDNRRHRSHKVVLPPDAAVLTPLDTLAWTSARFAYSAKAFELSQVVDDPRRVLQGVTLREVDPTDFNTPSGYGTLVPVTSTVAVVPPTQQLAGFDLLAHVITDGAAVSRRPALRLVWDGAEQIGLMGVEFEWRLAGGAVVGRASTTDVTSGELIISDGILPQTAYEAHARQVANWPTSWTGWEAVTTDAVPLQQIDLDGARYVVKAPGPFSPTGTAAVLATLECGPTEEHQIWSRSIKIEAKSPDYALLGGVTHQNRILIDLERRDKSLGGAWSGWRVVDTLSVTETDWVMNAATGSFGGLYDDIEYRCSARLENATAPGLASALIRNICLTVSLVTK